LVLGVALGKISERGVIVSGGHDGTVRLWDARTALRRRPPAPARLRYVTVPGWGCFARNALSSARGLVR
jgi:hypothetical protein